jgi:hypothetical protein
VVPVEITPFPRLSSEDTREVVYSRDRSASGLCVGTKRPQIEGRLVRVRVLEQDGHIKAPRLARVVWCSPRDGGEHWMGLELITARARRDAEGPVPG